MPSPAAAQLQFGAEFLGFLAATAGVALAFLRTSGRRAPIHLPIGFVALAASAFLAGSTVVGDRGSPVVAVLRASGAVLVGAAALQWQTGSRVRVSLVIGAIATAAAAPLAVFDLALATNVAVAAGGLAIGVSAFDQARRSVASRIAVSSGATLLALVLLLSVSISAVVDRTLRNEATRRLDERARDESKVINRELVNAIQFIALANDNLLVRQTPEAIQRQVAAGRPDRSLTTDLGQITKLYQSQAYLLLTPDGKVLAADGVQVDGSSLVVPLVGSEIVRTTTCQDPQVTMLVLGGQAYGTSAVAMCTFDQSSVLARFVALNPFDDRYLASRHRGDPNISFSLVTADAAVATSGDQPPPAEVRELATEARETVRNGGPPRSATLGDRFVSAAPIDLGNNEPPKLVLVASSPTSTILDAQGDLFTRLFLTALAGALAALVLAVVVGERIGSRIRRLTVAAEGVSRGEEGVRAELEGDDEVGTLGATFDAMAGAIEEKTAAETALRVRIEAVVAGMAEALVATDADARITDFNQAAEDLVGVSAATARGREVVEVVSLASDDGADLQARLKKPPRTRWTAGAMLHAVDGPPVPVAVSGGALRDEQGSVIGGVVLLRDLRGEREVERMKTEFLSRIGHELRTPLTGVLGYADLLLRREWPPERSRMMLEEVHSSARRLERIVELLEFFAAAAAGRTLLRLREVDVRALVDGVYRAWEPRVEPPVTLARKLSRTLPMAVADPRWLRMALDELVDNARKFSPGGGRIVVGAQQLDDGRIEVFVADRGVGMSAEEVGIAFDDFQQGDTSDTRSFGGLGLGLPLVQRVAEGHGGEVRCATTPGRGTRLSIILPVAQP